MIRYAVGRQQLLDDIEAEKPGWLQRAKAATAANAAAGHYTAGADIWGEIKRVYIRLQHEKCVYCESKLQGSELAAKVHEVEHFRPKSRLRAWPGSASRLPPGYTAPCPTGGPSDVGYYLLAYHPFNYAIACTRCNSTLKSDWFPVRGKRKVRLADPSWGHAEDPLLIYPISDLDDDPASLIGFDGVLPEPVTTDLQKAQRAAVTITFFALDAEDLTSRRASILFPHEQMSLGYFAHPPRGADDVCRRPGGALWIVLRAQAQTADPQLAADAAGAVKAICAPAAEFSACAASFKALFAADPTKAAALAQAARGLISGLRPNPGP